MQRLQRFQPCGQLGLPGRLLVHRLLGGAAFVVQLGHAVLQFLQHGVVQLGQLLCAGQLGLRFHQTAFVGRGQCVAVSGQTLAALVELAALLFNVALLGGQHLNLLLHLGHAGALFVGAGLGLAQAVFQRGQGHALLFALCRQHDRLVFGFQHGFGQLLQLHAGVFAARAPGADLLFKLHQALLYPLAAFHHKANLRFQLAHLGSGFVELALRLVHLVASGVVRLPDGFQLGFHTAQVGRARLQVVERLCGVVFHLGLVGVGLAALQKPQLVLLERGAGLQGFVARRHLGLLFQLVQVGVEFTQDVFHPREVFARVGQAVRGFAAALFVFGNTGGFFEKQAQLFGLAFNDAADGALANDGVGARAQAGAQKHVLHVPAAHGLVVDVVAAGAVAREHALDRNFTKLAPLAASAVVGVVKHQLHAGTAGGLAGVGAVEDHVLHGLATQLGRFGLAQHPAHRVHDVGLAATIGPHHAHQLAGEHEVGRLSEGLEPG